MSAFIVIVIEEAEQLHAKKVIMHEKLNTFVCVCWCCCWNHYMYHCRTRLFLVAVGYVEPPGVHIQIMFQKLKFCVRSESHKSISPMAQNP